MEVAPDLSWKCHFPTLQLGLLPDLSCKCHFPALHLGFEMFLCFSPFLSLKDEPANSLPSLVPEDEVPL